MPLFANGSILLTPSCFVRQCKMNIQNCQSSKRCHVRCHINWVQDFHLMLYLNPPWLNPVKNTDPCINKPLSLSSTKQCDDKPEDRLFPWFVSILFLQHHSNVMDLSWLPAIGNIYKEKKGCLYVHNKSK